VPDRGRGAVVPLGRRRTRLRHAAARHARARQPQRGTSDRGVADYGASAGQSGRVQGGCQLLRDRAQRGAMTDESKKKLSALLTAYAELKAKAQPASKVSDSTADRKRRACADCLRNIVRPVLDGFMTELKTAGHDATTRDHTDKEDA